MNESIRKILALKGRDVATASPDDTVLDAVTRMNQRRIGALLVVVDERPVGIFTERDVLTRVVAKQLDPGKVPVGEVMTRELISIGLDDTVAKAMKVMTDRRCRHLPVLEAGVVHGLLSIGDLTSWVVRDQQHMIDDLQDYVRRT